MEANNNSCIKEDEGLPSSQRSDGQLRSFDYKHGSVVDNGYQNKGIMKYVQKKRGESRRATCPEIWLFPETSNPARKVVLRIYGSKNTGKKTLAHQIYHLASTTTPEQIHVLSSDGKLKHAMIAHFLLNGEEIDLEILLESMLESSPFNANITIYIVVYTVDNRESFLRASDLLLRIYQSRNKSGAHVVLVGNKVDLKRNEVVTTIEGKSLAKTYKCSFVEISALLSVNIDIMWIELIKQLKEPAEMTSWVGKLVNRGQSIAKSCEEMVHRFIA